MSVSTQFCPDTNVLLRLQDVGALGIISSLTSCELILTDIVWDEATRKPGVGAAAKKILSGIGHVVKRDFIPNEPDTLMFEKLRNQYPESLYQDGELSVIALSAVDTTLVPIVFERRGHVAACDELRRPVLTGHWFFSELHARHGLPMEVLDALVAVLHAKSYLTPTWHVPSPAPPTTVAASPTTAPITGPAPAPSTDPDPT
jgi:hypothetical protein